MILPEKLYEFAVMATIRPENRLGGYIFSVVNPLDTIVQLGIHMSPVVRERWNLTLQYTDADAHTTSQTLTSFEMPFAKKWMHIALRVLSNKVTFFYNCAEMETKTVKREPIEFYFDSASILYLAQAGPILKGHFEVSFFCFVDNILNLLFKSIKNKQTINYRIIFGFQNGF